MHIRKAMLFWLDYDQVVVIYTDTESIYFVNDGSEPGASIFQALVDAEVRSEIGAAYDGTLVKTLYFEEAK